ncbi:3659_t:CDS:2 [Acaulospora morrowiae]|uniref:3659_t:CDS:1 n=1 Tax=Acaulospora morrowiae TaxID=94023 RepID=A0A9N9FK23_9GLOM|nr:3659_t:CDS:2 [Acaulospora morrowiae]
MEQSSEHIQVTIQMPSLWTETLILASTILEGNSFVIHLQKSEDKFKMEICEKLRMIKTTRFVSPLLRKNFNGLL